MIKIPNFPENRFSAYLECIMITNTYDHLAELLERSHLETWAQISPWSNRQEVAWLLDLIRVEPAISTPGNFEMYL